MQDDVIGFGEAMVRLAPPHFQRLEQARSFDIEVGGAELNTLVGLGRLGHRTGWVSRLPDSPLGRLVANRVREAGVSDRFVRYADDGRCGVYFYEFGAAPRPNTVLYDRKDSSISRVAPGMFDWPAILAGAKWFHVTGITAALSDGAAAAVGEALRAAKTAGVRTCVDLNYRAKLWSPADAGRVMGGLIPGCDLLIAGEADAAALFGITGADFGEVAAELADRFGLTAVAGARREAPLAWRNRVAAVGWRAGEVYESQWHEVEIVDRLGSGDALAAGVIHGLLAGDFRLGLDYGAALAALKHTLPGDLPWVTKAEVDEVLAGHGLRVRR